MKHRLILAATLLISGWKLTAQEYVQFKTGSFAELKKQAAATGKPILVDLYFEGCMPCKQMDNTTFKDAQVSALANQSFLSYKTDVMVENDGKELCVRYGASGFPTYLFLSPEGKIIDISSGYSNPARFKTMLEEALQANKEKRFKSFSLEKPLQDYPSFLYNRYFNKEVGLKEGEAVAYLDAQNDLLSENSFLVMSNFPTNARYQEYFLQHAEEYARRYSRMMVRNRLMNVVKAKGASFSAKGQMADFKQLLVQVKPYFGNDWNRFEKIFMEDYFRQSKDWAGLANYISNNSLYDQTDRIYLTNQLLAQEKTKASLVPLVSLFSPAQNFEDHYMMALLNWYAGHTDQAKSSLALALEANGGRGEEKKNASAFMSHIQDDPATFKPGSLMRFKPLLD